MKNMKLEDLQGVGKTIANKLKDSDIDSIEKIAELSEEELAKFGIAEKYIPKILEIAKEYKKEEENDPLGDEGEKATDIDINIWKIKKQIPNFLYNAFLKTLKNPEELSESQLDEKYKEFMDKKIF